MPRAYHPGFTVIELMIVLVIASIIALLAIPALGDFVTRNRMTTQANLLVAQLQYARSEAIKRHTNVTISSANGTADWSGGWTIAAAATIATPLRGAVAGTALKTVPALKGMTLTNPVASSISFDTTGLATTVQQVDFTLCPSTNATGKDGKRISVAVSGRAVASSLSDLGTRCP